MQNHLGREIGFDLLETFHCAFLLQFDHCTKSTWSLHITDWSLHILGSLHTYFIPCENVDEVFHYELPWSVHCEHCYNVTAVLLQHCIMNVSATQLQCFSLTAVLALAYLNEHFSSLSHVALTLLERCLIYIWVPFRAKWKLVQCCGNVTRLAMIQTPSGLQCHPHCCYVSSLGNVAAMLLQSFMSPSIFGTLLNL